MTSILYIFEVGTVLPITVVDKLLNIIIVKVFINKICNTY